MKKPLYFDHAATTPVDPKVLQAMRTYWNDKFHNPSSLYEVARSLRQDLQAARHKVAQLMGARAVEIIFTAGATEANNLAIFGTVLSHPDAKVVTTTIEHESILAPIASLKKAGWQVEQVPVGRDGIVDINKLAKAIDNRTVLVSVMYANNEIGTIQPIAKIGQLVRQVRSQRRHKLPLNLHSDGAQAPNYLDLHVNRLNVDMLTLNGSKIYGPKQSGCLYVKSGTQLEPIIYGGGQERGLRSGTENVPADIGFAEALDIALKMRKSESKRLVALRDSFIRRVLNEIDGVQLNGDAVKRLPNNINFIIAGVKGETLVHYLDSVGILVATGSACSANNNQPSHVLRAIGLSKAAVDSSLRITMGRSTTKPALEYLFRQLKTAVNKLRQLADAG
jgi:cysteine desulfurase